MQKDILITFPLIAIVAIVIYKLWPAALAALYVIIFRIQL